MTSKGVTPMRWSGPSQVMAPPVAAAASEIALRRVSPERSTTTSGATMPTTMVSGRVSTPSPNNAPPISGAKTRDREPMQTRPRVASAAATKFSA